jgi:hypothetical protein
MEQQKLNNKLERNLNQKHYTGIPQCLWPWLNLEILAAPHILHFTNNLTISQWPDPYAYTKFLAKESWKLIPRTENTIKFEKNIP